MSLNVSRRRFLQAGAALASYSVLAPRVGAASPNGKLRTAHMGVGGMGGADLGSISSHAKVEVAALCDVDANTLDRVKAHHPQRQDVPRLSRNALGNGRPHRRGGGFDARPYACPGGDDGAEPQQAGLLPKAADARSVRGPAVAARGREARAADANGNSGAFQPAVSPGGADDSRRRHRQSEPACTPGRARTGATTAARCPPSGAARERSIGTCGWARRTERPFVPGVYHPGQLAEADRLRHRHARRHGRAHLRHAVCRARTDGPQVGQDHLPRAHRHRPSREERRRVRVPRHEAHDRVAAVEMVRRRLRAARRRAS